MKGKMLRSNGRTDQERDEREKYKDRRRLFCNFATAYREPYFIPKRCNEIKKKRHPTLILCFINTSNRIRYVTQALIEELIVGLFRQ